MDAKEKKSLYYSLKQDASYNGWGLLFNDKQQILFIKKFRWRDCLVYKYSDIFETYWSEKDGTINKGHPILGAMAGNAVGGFSAGFMGALWGQQMPGKKIPYIESPSVTIAFKDGSEYKCQFYNGLMKTNGIRGAIFRKSMEKLSDQFDRAQGKPSAEDYIDSVWKS